MKLEDLKQLLLHLCKGLKYIHSQELVHMDMKPGNVFLSYAYHKHTDESSDDGYSGDEDHKKDRSPTYDVIYKIGDLGMYE